MYFLFDYKNKRLKLITFYFIFQSGLARKNIARTLTVINQTQREQLRLFYHFPLKRFESYYISTVEKIDQSVILRLTGFFLGFFFLFLELSLNFPIKKK